MITSIIGIVTAKPSQIFEALKKNPAMLTPEEPLGCCPNCGVQLDGQLGLYRESDQATELTRLRAGLQSLSERELAELSELLPEGKEYDQAKFVIGHLIRLKQDAGTPVLKRAA